MKNILDAKKPHRTTGVKLKGGDKHPSQVAPLNFKSYFTTTAFKT